MKRRIWRGMRIWLKEMTLLTRAGLAIVVVGAMVDLFYHGIFATIQLLPPAQADIVQYAGHWITLAGMLIMFVGVLREAYVLSHKNRPPAPSRSSVYHLFRLRRH